MKFAGLVKTSLLDFPGRLSCVLFTDGCPYDCFYCHNRITINGDAAGIPVGQIQEFLEKRQGLLEGVVVSGGEPTIHRDLEDFISQVKAMGYAVKLDTNGCNPQAVTRLLEQGLLDYVALDVKAPWDRYQEICGSHADPLKVRDTMTVLQASTIMWEVRTTMAPTLGFEDLFAIAGQMPRIPAWRLNPYRIPEVYRPEDEIRIKAFCPSVQDLQEWTLRLKLMQPNMLAVE